MQGMMAELQQIYTRLLKEYGRQGWWPLLDLGSVRYRPGDKNYGGYHPGEYSYPKTDAQRFEICVGAILTQNTAWNNVKTALANLKAINALSAKRMATIGESALKKAIRPAGYYNQKARKLKGFARFFMALKGRTPTREELLAVWGIGPETADSILLYAYKRPSFVIDAYTKRIMRNLGLIDSRASYDDIKALFEQSLQSDAAVFQEYHALLVEHAKRFYKGKSEYKHCPLYKRFAEH